MAYHIPDDPSCPAPATTNKTNTQISVVFKTVVKAHIKLQQYFQNRIKGFNHDHLFVTIYLSLFNLDIVKIRKDHGALPIQGRGADRKAVIDIGMGRIKQSEATLVMAGRRI